VERRLAFQASREVRHTVIRVITAHLNGTAPVSWCGLNLDFAGAVFDGGDFSGAKFSGGTVDFTGAEFPGGRVNFAGAEFSGGTVDFSQVASWTQPPDFGSGFDMSHPPAGVMLPTATSPSPDSPARKKPSITA
jgi:Pentapeptide repeats (9 copies)